MLKVIVPALFLMTTFFGGDLATAKTPKATKNAPAACCATKKKETASCCAKPNCCADRACGMGADCCAPGSDCCVDGQCKAGKKVARKTTR